MPGSGLGRLSDPVTSWELTGNIYEPGHGYVISELIHDSNAFADEIRIERIILAGRERAGSKPRVLQFKLGSSEIRRLGEPNLLALSPTATGPLGYYTPQFGIETKYRMDQVFGEPNQPLDLTLKYLFTPYSKNPTHEPAGVLRASRFYPLIEFSVPAIPSMHSSDNRLAGITVIYRMKINIGGTATTNQAGLWRDHDSLWSNVWGGVSLTYGTAFFAAAEKPLMYEVVANGLSRGKPGPWDNVHQWNGDGKSKLPATPGLPFGLHLHWRWTAQAYAPGRILPGGGAHMGGVGGAGGPMIDGRIPDQTFEIAFTMDDPQIDQALANAVGSGLYKFGDPLSSLITPARSTPNGVAGGAQLVIWIAVTARSKDFPLSRQPISQSSSRWGAFEGTLFAHGLFFSHETKVSAPPLAGRPQYVPKRPNQQWVRP